MATFLYRLGRFTFRRRRLVLAIWLALLVALGTAASTLSGQFSNEFSIPGTESQEGLDLLEERFPEAGLELGSANVVLAAPPGERIDDPQYRQAAEDVLEQVRGLDDVVNVTDPFATQAVSPDGRVARATATVRTPRERACSASRATSPPPAASPVTCSRPGFCRATAIA